MFLVGNLISVAVVVSEIAEFDVCFDETLSDDDDKYTPEQAASTVFTWTMISLVVGLSIDASSALILSAIYRSPLDIKSAHKIPPGDMRNCVGTAMLKCVAPFSWAVVYFSGPCSSIYFGDYPPCGDRVDGSVIQGYLMCSGVVMGFLSISMLVLAFSMCSPVLAHHKVTVRAFLPKGAPVTQIRGAQDSCRRAPSWIWDGSCRERTCHIERGRSA